eukprot:CAMPEP_0119123654 /NCGR_PEP_ID=MMETSP1310-20130426/3529_1 /TAXON_ID=464262 /ORGANISM="Genus nov. species nov., Strain RCC2339" /LENGTH=63 /DNA_ID=CAMNT_0007113501 /DNA_START=98 /DNA_END=286 /DNA_ORIENTATION=-
MAWGHRGRAAQRDFDGPNGSPPSRPAPHEPPRAGATPGRLPEAAAPWDLQHHAERVHVAPKTD